MDPQVSLVTHSARAVDEHLRPICSHPKRWTGLPFPTEGPYGGSRSRCSSSERGHRVTPASLVVHGFSREAELRRACGLGEIPPLPAVVREILAWINACLRTVVRWISDFAAVRSPTHCPALWTNIRGASFAIASAGEGGPSAPRLGNAQALPRVGELR
jgi:hypothetical protein